MSPILDVGIDLLVGFMKKPEGLDEFLLGQGYVLQEDHPAGAITNVAVRKFRYERRGLSLSGVSCCCFDGVDVDDQEFWTTLTGDVPVVSTATLSTPKARNGFDEMVQYMTATQLRNRYAAVVFDAYDGEVLE